MASLTFAIGDIHGRLDLLGRAIAAIADHAGDTPYQVVCLGDYVDRGPDSRRVVEVLMTLNETGAWHCLMGNHEDMMVQSLRTRRSDELDRWMDNGGDATLDSYDDQVPVGHVTWLAGLPLTHRDAHRLYVHAGIEPDMPIDTQDRRFLLWIRERFLTARSLPCHVVHGHTPRWREKPAPEKPERLPHRTNLDTGAYFTGVLSVGVFDDAVAGGPVHILAIM